MSYGCQPIAFLWGLTIIFPHLAIFTIPIFIILLANVWLSSRSRNRASFSAQAFEPIARQGDLDVSAGSAGSESKVLENEPLKRRDVSQATGSLGSGAIEAVRSNRNQAQGASHRSSSDEIIRICQDTSVPLSSAFFQVTGIGRLFHFTDRRNLPGIRAQRGLFSRRDLLAMGCLPAVTGGNQWSLDADVRSGMDGFVHLCLTRRHPMEFIARKEGRLESSVYLEVDLRVLDLRSCLFTPGVSNKSGVRPLELDEIIHHWRLDDLKAASSGVRISADAYREIAKYEVLVKRNVPIEMIRFD